MNTSRFFYVTGRGPFPVDMLRYDACWPETDAASTMIAESFTDNPKGQIDRYVVALVSNALYSPHVDRWASFGWLVIETPHPVDLEDLALDPTMFPQGHLS